MFSFFFRSLVDLQFYVYIIFIRAAKDMYSEKMPESNL